MAVVPCQKIPWSSREAWENGVFPYLEDLFRLPAYIAALRREPAGSRTLSRSTLELAQSMASAAYLAPHVATVAHVNRTILRHIPGASVILRSHTTEVYVDVDGGETSLSTPAATCDFLDDVHISGALPGRLELKRGALVTVAGVHLPGHLKGDLAVVASVSQDEVSVYFLNDFDLSDPATEPLPSVVQRHTSTTSRSLPKLPQVEQQLRRTNFPLVLAWGETIDAAEGRTTSRTVLDLLAPVFSHGHLTVGLSRTRLPRNTVIFHLKDQLTLFNRVNSLVFPRTAAARRASHLGRLQRRALDVPRLLEMVPPSFCLPPWVPTTRAPAPR